MRIDGGAEGGARIEGCGDPGVDGEGDCGENEGRQQARYDPTMLHIHNGDAVKALADGADIPGRHFAFREALADGPVTRDVSIDIRAPFLKEAYGVDAREELAAQEATLDAARYEIEVILWFEHDLFCVINLLYLLRRLRSHPRLMLVWSPRPLSKEPLGALFDRRVPVTEAMHEAAGAAWNAYTSPDPTALNGFAEDALPFVSDAMRLHATRFPAAGGLGRVERSAMQIIGAEKLTFEQLFREWSEENAGFGFGDLQLLGALKRLNEASVPPIAMDGDGISVTDAGRRMLRGEDDFIELNGIDLWLGGAHLEKGRMWRWDAQRAEIVPSPSAA